MFKRLLLLTLAIGSFQLLSAQDAPSVDEILENYYESIGGVEQWKELQTMKMTATMALQGMEFPGTMYMARPDKVRNEMNVQGQEMIMAYDGEDAWWINPFATGPDPQTMPADQAEGMTKQEFEYPLIDYKEKGHSVEYVGTAEVDGTPTYEVKLTKENGDVTYYYFDQEYFVPIMEKMEATSGPQKGSYVEVYQSDYQEVDGLMVPFFIEQKMGGTTILQMTLKDVELNPDLEEGMFSRPKK